MEIHTRNRWKPINTPSSLYEYLTIPQCSKWKLKTDKPSSLSMDYLIELKTFQRIVSMQQFIFVSLWNFHEKKNHWKIFCEFAYEVSCFVSLGSVVYTSICWIQISVNRKYCGTQCIRLYTLKSHSLLSKQHPHIQITLTALYISIGEISPNESSRANERAIEKAYIFDILCLHILDGEILFRIQIYRRVKLILFSLHSLNLNDQIYFSCWWYKILNHVYRCESQHIFLLWAFLEVKFAVKLQFSLVSSRFTNR